MLCRVPPPRLLVALVLLLTSFAGVANASGHFQTANFTITAANDQIARKVGEYAERWRREKAMEWLGREMPTWGRPCPLHVIISAAGSSGETTFAFDQGAILDQQMRVEGTLERVLDSVLPHEITHTVFAYRFRQPLPRWADEGGCVLSEDDHERQKHDDKIRRVLARGNQAFRLRVLMTMMQYPTRGENPGEDVITLYAQGYSLVRFLVESSSKPVFLDFLADAVNPQIGWDLALQKHYQVRDIDDLEVSWLKWMTQWYNPQARLMKQGDSHVAKGMADSTSASGQQQAARVSTPSSTVRSEPVSTSGSDRPWSAINDAPPPKPNNPGWKPVQARLGGAVPAPD
jgi:hypothetical protein